MAELELTPKQRQVLKGQAHALSATVLLGNQGLTDAVVKEIDRALAAHELIKVRVPGDERDARNAIYREVAERLNAARVQSIGKLLVFYRPLPEDSKPAAAARPAAPTRSPKAPAQAPRPKKAAGNAGPARSTTTRGEVRRSTARTSAPRKPAGRAR
jgi:putative YhbY family RNA-binding protein